MSTTIKRGTGMAPVPASTGRAQVQIGMLDGAAAAFGVSAAIAIVFNTVLAWIKDAYDPLNSFMASLTGHHWTTHGLVDIAVFGILGWLLMKRGIAIDGAKLATMLAGAAVVGGGGLALWFVLV
jgi:hypothetical protein